MSFSFPGSIQVDLAKEQEEMAVIVPLGFEREPADISVKFNSTSFHVLPTIIGETDGCKLEMKV